jgi:hypothetical protein
VSDLTAAVAYADGHYVLPRFELPDPLWESCPRQDPAAIIKACDRLGKALHLNEVAVSHPYMGVNSPGDFQLIPRQTLFGVFGFDERMIHGWHVDFNMYNFLGFLLTDEGSGPYTAGVVHAKSSPPAGPRAVGPSPADATWPMSGVSSTPATDGRPNESPH